MWASIVSRAMKYTVQRKVRTSGRLSSSVRHFHWPRTLPELHRTLSSLDRCPMESARVNVHALTCTCSLSLSLSLSMSRYIVLDSGFQISLFS